MPARLANTFVFVVSAQYLGPPTTQRSWVDSAKNVEKKIGRVGGRQLIGHGSTAAAVRVH